jgi:hypothetical protein
MSSIFNDILDSFGDLFYTDKKFDIAKTGGVAAALANVFGKGIGGSNPPYGVVGYGGDIPRYTASRSQVPNTYDPNRRPGSGGQRYFSDMQYTQIAPTLEGARTTPLSPEQKETLAAARKMGSEQATGLAALNLANPAREMMPIRAALPEPPPVVSSTKPLNEPKLVEPEVSPPVVLPKTGLEGLRGLGNFKMGGLAELKKGKYLDGATDGMADKVLATIDKTQPAALSDGEFVIPADVVSHLGNGNSDAGARVLSKMMDRVRMARTGSKKQGKEIDPNKFLPA